MSRGRGEERRNPRYEKQCHLYYLKGKCGWALYFNISNACQVAHNPHVTQEKPPLQRVKVTRCECCTEEFITALAGEPPPRTRGLSTEFPSQ